MRVVMCFGRFCFSHQGKQYIAEVHLRYIRKNGPGTQFRVFHEVKKWTPCTFEDQAAIWGKNLSALLSVSVWSAKECQIRVNDVFHAVFVIGTMRSLRVEIARNTWDLRHMMLCMDLVFSAWMCVGVQCGKYDVLSYVFFFQSE